MLSDNYLRIPLEQIHVKRDERQRRAFDTTDIEPSIRARGVVNPIIVEREGDGRFLLIAGERRLAASRAVGLKDIPCRLASDLSPTERSIIELEENVKRKDLPWQDEALAYYKIHGLYLQLDSTWTQAKTAESIGISPMMISMFLQVAEEIEKKNPRVLACTGARAAYNIIARRTDRAVADVMNDLMAEVPARQAQFVAEVGPDSKIAFTSDNDLIAVSPERSPLIISAEERSILQTNFHQFAQTYTGPPFNFIHCDFPYGINHQDSDQGGSARWGGYSDTDEDYWQLCTTLCQYLDYLFTPSAHLMFWCSSDIERQYETIQFFKQNAPSLEFQTVPLYWHKTDNRGIIPDPKRAPRRIVETALIASRGDRLITRAVSNAYGSPTTKEIHQSEKPEPMLRHFLQMFVDENTRMLDPTCGSATSIRAVESLGGKGLGLEIDGEIVEAARSSLRRARLLRKHQEHRDGQLAAASSTR